MAAEVFEASNSEQRRVGRFGVLGVKQRRVASRQKTQALQMPQLASRLYLRTLSERRSRSALIYQELFFSIRHLNRGICAASTKRRGGNRGRRTMWLRVLCTLILIAGASVAAQGKSRWQSCLPADVDAGEVISLESVAPGREAKKVTVTTKLNQIGARCRANRLVDAKGKQIHFYRLIGCWGNPPLDYQEILDNQQKELAQLRRRYRVIEITCNPSGVMLH